MGKCLSHSGQKLHESERPAEPSAADAARERPGFDNRGARNIRAESERLSCESAGSFGSRAAGPSFGATARLGQLSGRKAGRVCSLCGGGHAEYACPIVIEPEPSAPVVRSDHARRSTGPAPRVLTLPPGVSGEDLAEVRSLVSRARAQKRAPELDEKQRDLAERLGLVAKTPKTGEPWNGLRYSGKGPRGALTREDVERATRGKKS